MGSGFLFVLFSLATIALHTWTHAGWDMDRWLLRQFFAVRGELMHPQDIIIVSADRALIKKHNDVLPKSIILDSAVES